MTPRPGNILVVYTGQNAVSLEAPFRGTLVAPAATVSAAGGLHHIARLYARSVELHQAAVLEGSSLLRIQALSPTGAAALELADQIVGGAGTREDPYLVLRDNPRLRGVFPLQVGESVSGTTFIDPVDGEAAQGLKPTWSWQGDDTVFGVLNEQPSASSSSPRSGPIIPPP